jgi:hypothetical protein
MLQAYSKKELTQQILFSQTLFSLHSIEVRASTRSVTLQTIQKLFDHPSIPDPNSVKYVPEGRPAQCFAVWATSARF